MTHPTPLVDEDKQIAELLTALHHTRRPDAMAVLRTGLGARHAAATGHPAARALRRASPAVLLAGWVSALATAALDTIQLDFLSLADPQVLHGWCRERPALAGLAALRAHGQAMDPECAPWCGDGAADGLRPDQFAAANEQLHQDAQLCLYALAQLWAREDQPVELEADAADSRQVHAALTAVAFRLAEFANEHWGEALAAFTTGPAWDEALVQSLGQSDAPEHYPACALVLRRFRPAHAPEPQDRAPKRPRDAAE